MPPHRLASCIVLAAAALSGGAVHAAGGAVAKDMVPSLRITVERPHFVCARGDVSLSRIVHRRLVSDARVAPLPCCDGQFGCAQFLSTTTILHGPRSWRG